MPQDPRVDPPIRAVTRRRRPGPPPAGSSLRPELLSGRSLAPPPKPRRQVLRERRRLILVIATVVLLLLAVLAGKLVAERAADSATAQRTTELQELLADATTEDFLAFGAGVRNEGSLAHAVRNQDGFQNVQANAERAFIRIQPSGWWAGFTERCLVVVVDERGADVSVPKTNCVRVPVPD